VCKTKLHEIYRRGSSALADKRQEKYKLRATIYDLKKTELTEIDQQIANCRKVCKSLEENHKRSLARLKKLEERRKALENPAARKAAEKKLAVEKAKLEKLDAEINKAYEPFKQEADKLRSTDSYKAASDKLKKLMEQCFLYPKKDLPELTAQPVRTDLANGFASCNWTSTTNGVIWSNIVLEELPADLKCEKKLLGKYPIIRQDKNMLWLWAGNFKVMLSVRDNELLTKAPITKLVTQLIDLDYLSRISPMKVAPVKAPKVPKAPKTK
jgi:hypothetical protein